MALVIGGCGESGSGTAGDAAGTNKTPVAENQPLTENASTPDQVPVTPAETDADKAEQVRAYVSQFIKDDPDRCFDALVALEQPELEAQKNAGSDSPAPPVRVVVAVDGSGSMAGRIGGQTKLELAREAATRFIDGLPPSVEAALLVFGQQGDNTPAGKAKSCAGVDLLAPMSQDRAQLGAAVSGIRAVGWTPLAAGLEQAESLFAQSSTVGEQVIYVVSDGEETCGGDPVAVARRINSGSTRAIVNIIGFGLPSKEVAALKAVSDAGGGNFINVTSRVEYDRTMEEVRESFRQSANALRRSDAIVKNGLQTSDADTYASLCISDIDTSEGLRMSDDLTARALRGEAFPYERAALDLMKARHQAMKERLNRYLAQLKADESKAQQKIDQAAEAAR
jgi:Ca-activated chloride channel family protein